MSVSEQATYSSEELLDLWAPSMMPSYLEPFNIVASLKCLTPVSLLPSEERRQFQRPKPRSKKLTGSVDNVALSLSPPEDSHRDIMTSSEPIGIHNLLTDEDLGSTLGPLWGIQIGKNDQTEEPPVSSYQPTRSPGPTSPAVQSSPLMNSMFGRNAQFQQQASPQQQQQQQSVMTQLGGMPQQQQQQHHQPMMTQLSSPQQQPMPQQHLQNSNVQKMLFPPQQPQQVAPPPAEALWIYQDPQGKEQGPHPSNRMLSWFTVGYFPTTLMVKRVEWQGFAPLIQLLAASPYPPFSPLFAADRDYSQKVVAEFSQTNFNATFAANNNNGGGAVIQQQQQQQQQQPPMIQEGFQQQKGVFTLDAVEGPAKPARKVAPSASATTTESASTAKSGSMYGKVQQQIAKSSENASTDVNALLWGQKESAASSDASKPKSASPPPPTAEDEFPPVRKEETVVVKKTDEKPAVVTTSKAKKKANRKKEKAAAAAAAAAAAKNDDAEDKSTNVIVTKESVVISPTTQTESKPHVQVPAPYVQKAPVKPKKQSLMEVMAEEQRKANEENAIREVREQELEAERKAKQSAGMWNSGSKGSTHKPTLREIMELEEREEKLRQQNQRAQAVDRPSMTMGGAQASPGWGSFATPAKTGKSLREIQAEEERVMKNKSRASPAPSSTPPAAAASSPAPVADEEYFWGHKPKTQPSQVAQASEEDFPSLPGAKPKPTKAVAGGKNSSMAAKVSQQQQQKGGGNQANAGGKKGKKKMVKMDL